MSKPHNAAESIFEVLFDNGPEAAPLPTAMTADVPKITLVLPEKMERRESARIQFRGEIYLHHSSAKLIKAVSQDISATGIGVVIDVNATQNFEAGQKLTLEFSKAPELRSLLIPVEVVNIRDEHSGRKRLGFRLGTLTKSVEKKLREFMDEAIRNPWNGPKSFLK